MTGMTRGLAERENRTTILPNEQRIWNTLCLRTIATLCCGVGLSMAIHGPSLATSPNVVLFFVDDLGWTDWQSRCLALESDRESRL